MRTIKLTIEYDGTNYCGWQIQPNGVSVQGVLRKALRSMTGENNHVIGASRTDTGVHALGQVAHFKTNTKIPSSGFLKGINSKIGSDIAVIDSEKVSENFHAQKSAKSKHYRYLILNKDVPSALLLNRCWQIREKLNIKAMRQAAKCLIGEHDFKSFQSAGSSAKDAVREIKRISIGIATSPAGPRNDKLISIDIVGTGFVYHMVRNIVGALVLIGKGKALPKYMKEVLMKKERKMAGVCAPAMGLYLVLVKY